MGILPVHVHFTLSVSVQKNVVQMANVSRLRCNTGFKYEHDGQLYVRYSTKKGVKYLKCVGDSCPGRASMKNRIIHVTGEHVQHDEVK